MALQVQEKVLEPQVILSIKRRVTFGQLDWHISSCLERIYNLLEEQHAAPAGAPFGIYHGRIDYERDGPIEVCVPVSVTARASREVVGRRLGGGHFAGVTLRGKECAFPQILSGYRTVYSWVRRHGYLAPEPPRELWHSRAAGEEAMEIVLLYRERRAPRW